MWNKKQKYQKYLWIMPQLCVELWSIPTIPMENPWLGPILVSTHSLPMATDLNLKLLRINHLIWSIVLPVRQIKGQKQKVESIFELGCRCFYSCTSGMNSPAIVVGWGEISLVPVFGGLGSFWNLASDWSNQWSPHPGDTLSHHSIQLWLLFPPVVNQQ